LARKKLADVCHVSGCTASGFHAKATDRNWLSSLLSVAQGRRRVLRWPAPATMHAGSITAALEAGSSATSPAPRTHGLSGRAGGSTGPAGRDESLRERCSAELRIFTAWPILHVFSYHLPTDLPASRLIETNCAACFSYWPAAAHLRRSDGCCGWVGPSEQHTSCSVSAVRRRRQTSLICYVRTV